MDQITQTEHLYHIILNTMLTMEAGHRFKCESLITETSRDEQICYVKACVNQSYATLYGLKIIPQF